MARTGGQQPALRLLQPQQRSVIKASDLTRRGLIGEDVPKQGTHPLHQGVVIVGTDRTTASGDVANKIGTYLKALAAYDNGVPFYVALPSPTIDFSVTPACAHAYLDSARCSSMTSASLTVSVAPRSVKR